MADIIETESLLQGRSRIISVTLRNDQGVEAAASAFRVIEVRPNAAAATTVLAPIPGSTSTYEWSVNFTIAGDWTIRMESDSPDSAWEKLYRVLPSMVPGAN
jgi:hypothetical protein